MLRLLIVTALAIITLLPLPAVAVSMTETAAADYERYTEIQTAYDKSLESYRTARDSWTTTWTKHQENDDTTSTAIVSSEAKIYLNKSLDVYQSYLSVIRVKIELLSSSSQPIKDDALAMVTQVSDWLTAQKATLDVENADFDYYQTQLASIISGWAEQKIKLKQAVTSLMIDKLSAALTQLDEFLARLLIAYEEQSTTMDQENSESIAAALQIVQSSVDKLQTTVLDASATIAALSESDQPATLLDTTITSLTSANTTLKKSYQILTDLVISTAGQIEPEQATEPEAE